MFDPTKFPYIRVQNYSDDIPPDVLADEFYNPVQDALARLFGAGPGLTMSSACEEFDREPQAAVVAGEQLGTEMVLQTALDAEATASAGIDEGDHGVWKVQATAASFDTIIRDSMVFPGVRRFIWTARVRFTGSGNFEALASEGVVIGTWAAVADTLPAFRWGPDAPLGEWQAYYNDGGDVFLGTGVELLDDTWYTLIIARDGTDGKIRYFIGTGTADPVLVATSAVAIAGSITGARRFMRCRGTAGSAAGDGYWIDKYARGIER